VKIRDFYKTIRRIEIEGRVEEIETNPTINRVLDSLVEKGQAVDLGTQCRFIGPPCAICRTPLHFYSISASLGSKIEYGFACIKCRTFEKED
jgi:hypothetical protein